MDATIFGISTLFYWLPKLLIHSAFSNLPGKQSFYNENSCLSEILTGFFHCYWKWQFSSNIETHFQFGYLYRWSYKAIISLFEGYMMVVCINSYRSIIAVSAIWRIISEHRYRPDYRNLENSLFMNGKLQYVYHRQYKDHTLNKNLKLIMSCFIWNLK